MYKLHCFSAGVVFPLSTITKPPLNLIQYSHASPLILVAHWSVKSGQARATWDTVTTASITIFSYHSYACVQTSAPSNFADYRGEFPCSPLTTHTTVAFNVQSLNSFISSFNIKKSKHSTCQSFSVTVILLADITQQLRTMSA